MANGSRMVRLCIRGDCAREAMELHATQLFGPARLLWPALTQLVRGGGQLFPNWPARSVLNELQNFALAEAWRNADKLGTHSLRKGSARAFLEAGGSFSRLIRSDNGVLQLSSSIWIWGAKRRKLSRRFCSTHPAKSFRSYRQLVCWRPPARVFVWINRPLGPVSRPRSRLDWDWLRLGSAGPFRGGSPGCTRAGEFVCRGRILISGFRGNRCPPANRDSPPRSGIEDPGICPNEGHPRIQRPVGRPIQRPTRTQPRRERSDDATNGAPADERAGPYTYL